ncbi:AI-2 transport protein TqsA [Anatilimnocola aggregata]|uniref:AI-2 transport protein TqsA n=1 Tax=Anatilimnocola aggregata TaxID=2528021 RepID=A0A517YBL9_9BACT|nr:AI-2 transport protein TqsA [Anatilimnocola aggregata]
MPANGLSTNARDGRADLAAPTATVALPRINWPLRWTVAATLIVAATIVLGLGLIWLRHVGLMLFGGVVLATALRPIIELVASRCHVGRVHAAIVVYGIFSLLFIAAIVALVPEIIGQGQSLLEKLPGWYDNGRDYLLASQQRVLLTLGKRIPAEMPDLDKVMRFGAGMSGSETSPLEIIMQVGTGILGVLAVGVLAFYWSVNEEQTIRSLLQLAPDYRRTFFQSLVDEMLFKLGGYIRGQMILCAAVGVLSLIAYLVIGLPYALLLALIACVLEAVPIIGPTLGAIPAILVALSLGVQETALVIGAAMLIQTLENYLLVPKIMDRSVGIGAIVTLLAIVAFGAIFGLTGAIFAIPLAAISQTLFERLVLLREFKQEEFTTSRDAAGVLHYQLLDLIHDVKRQQRQKDIPVDNWTTESFAELETLAVALDEMVQEDEVEPAPPKPIAAVTQ